MYDQAYNVSNTTQTATSPQQPQNPLGDSRPYQVAAFNSATLNGQTNNAFDATDQNSNNTGPALPSGHTTYAYTESILLGMLVPQDFQAMLLRGSEYANSRIVLGVHYTLDIIASRSFVQYDLAQFLNNPAYLSNSSVTGVSAAPANTGTSTSPSTAYTPTAVNFPNLFTSAATELQTQVAANGSAINSACTTLANCVSASNSTNPYAYSVANANAYAARLTYDLPILSFVNAPREQAPSGSADASILLATIYGGYGNSTAMALATAANPTLNNVHPREHDGAGLYGSLTPATIAQIIVNTETNAIAAFSGTSLSYWSRINLYAAAGYFNAVTGTLQLASTDQVNTNVVVAGASKNVNNDTVPAGILSGNGTINGNLTVSNGGALGAQGNGTTSYSPLTVNGTTSFAAGSKVVLTGVFLPGTQYTLLSTSGANAIALDPSVIVDTTTTGTLLQYLSGKLSVVGDPSLVVTLTANLANAANTPNQKAVAAAIDTAANAGTYGTNGATLLNNLISTTVANGPAAFSALSGEGLTGQQQTALNTGNVFVSTILGQATFWSDGGNDVFGMKDGGSLKDGYNGAVASRARVWASGFGQYASLNGETSNGSANLSSQTSGVVTGVDYQVTQNLLAGIAGGYSSSNFSVGSRATSGTADGAHFGVYGMERWGAFYVAGTAGYSHYDNTTDRFVTGLGAGGLQEERGRFSGDEWLARFEGGYKTRVDGVNVTPFAGFQLAELSNNAFSETNVGAAVAGLNVNAQTVDFEKTFLGVQFDNKEVLGNGWVLTPYARLSWEHEFNTDRSIAASLLSLPGSAFTVYGASAASDVARVNAGFKLDVSANVAVFTNFDGEFSDRGNSYTGTGGVKIRW